MKKKIKILFLIDQLLPGGTEKQLILLVEHLSRENFLPVIGVLEDSEYNKKLNLKTPVVIFDSNFKYPFRTIHRLFKITRYLYRERIHILQSFFNTSTIVGAFSIVLLKSKPILISTRRNLYHWLEEEPIRFKLVRLTARWSDKILVNSFAVYEKAISLEAISRGKMEVIHNAIDINCYNKISPADAREFLGLNREDFIVGVVANWRPVKGLTFFLEAAGIIANRYPKVKFILAGFGPQKEELVALAKKLKIDQQTLFLDGQKSVDCIIPAFDIAVQPSLSESFSNVLLEYMACGKPIVATRVGEADRVLKENKNGLIVNPADSKLLAEAIIFLYKDPELRKNIGELNRQKVAGEWTVSKIVNRHEILFQALKDRHLDE